MAIHSSEGDIEFLPIDLISCILLWLPISSLLRFKSVCKSWLSLIESPDFVDRHIHVSSSLTGEDGRQKLNLLILTSPFPFDKPQQVSLFSIPDHNQVSLDFPVIDDHYQVNPVEIVTSCNGIICLRQHRTICLWNPATKQCTNLPPLPVVIRRFIGALGFGFDPTANDYKVVAIELSAAYEYVFYIFRLSSDSWRKFEGLAPPGLTIMSNNLKHTLYRDTMYCWLAQAYDDDRHIVFMFDFGNEIFTSIPTPSSLYVYALFTTTKNIACAGQLRNAVDNQVRISYEIWMLSDNQVKESWTKLYSINLDPSIITWLKWDDPSIITWLTWISKDEREFLLFLIGKQLAMYDPVSQEVTNLPFHASDTFEVVMYRESILSLKRGIGAAHGHKSTDCSQRMSIGQSMTENSDWSDSDVHKAVINRILLWLPAFSLQRFKSVCKSWHSLIQSSDFVTQHLSLHHHQHEQDNLSLILHSVDVFEESSLHSLYASSTCLLSNGTLELLDYPICEYFPIHTSFNGIVCLGNDRYGDCFLWNPVTKQFRDLCPDRVHNYGETFHLGFGFDTKTNNYKLVRFFLGDDNNVQIYFLSTGSWRTISDEVLPTLRWISGDFDATYRDGIYCWLVAIGSSEAILSFDFSNEVFRTIPLPHNLNISSLAVLRDNIVCISIYGSEDSNEFICGSWSCEIWMMNEYGVTESLSKLCTVGPFSKDWSFMKCYSKKSGDYMLLQNDGQLYEYNLVTQERERLPCQIQGSKDYQVVAYEPSLVPIK